MPLYSTTVLAPRRPRLGRVAALAIATCATAGAVTIVIADDQPAPQVRSIAEPGNPATARYFDVEANKAAGMRALSRHTAEQRTDRTSRYHDLEANKARSGLAR